MGKSILRGAAALGLACLVFATLAPDAGAQAVPYFEGVRQAENPEEVATVLEILILLTVLTLAPSILVLMTAFTRIVIVLSFVSRALATQNLPPTQVIVGLSLILTFLVMQPTFREIKDEALVPYLDEEITQKEMFRRAEKPMRNFMFQHTRREDVKLFIDLTEFDPGKPKGEVRRSDIPTYILVPAFVISELTRAFQMGFALFLPFVVIDMVVAATLISMGMLVLPPILISLPFKILLFVLVDGWRLVVGSLIQSFY
ncbi:MAG: flagellar type III secretion system pore protein FliP [Planctomycetes bacterium]|nr:flagellar type III secretion system pore protein FliP [Planctomycetota bacterium]